MNNLDTMSSNSELYNAIRNNNVRQVHRHIQLFSRDTRFDMGRTMLHVAAFYNRHRIVDILTNDYNITDNIKDYEGKTALIVAVKGGHLSIVQRLITDFNINLQDNRGITPLLEAYRCNHMVICEYLLQQGADYTKVSHDGLFFIPTHRIQALLRPTTVDVLFARQGQIQRDITIARHTIITPQIEYTRTDVRTHVPTHVPTHFKNEFIEMAIALKKTCSVCLECFEKDKTIFTTCSHLLCSSCFEDERLTKCPLCRVDIK